MQSYVINESRRFFYYLIDIILMIISKEYIVKGLQVKEFLTIAILLFKNNKNKFNYYFYIFNIYVYHNQLSVNVLHIELLKISCLASHYQHLFNLNFSQYYFFSRKKLVYRKLFIIK